MSALTGLSRRCGRLVPFLMALAAAGCGPGDGSRGFRPGPAPVECLAFAPDGKTLAVARGPGVALWDAEKGTEVGRLPDLPGGVTCLAYRPDGRALAVGGISPPPSEPGAARQTVGVSKANPEGSLVIFDPAARQPRTTFPVHAAPLTAIAFSPDGKVLASAAGDPNPYHLVVELKLWDADTGAARADLSAGLKLPALGLAFSPDGKSLATGGRDGNVKVWDAETRKERVSLDGQVGTVTALAFAPDGRTLAAAGSSPGIRLWDTAAWKEKATLPGHKARVTRLAFAPSGQTLASASEDGTVCLWDPGAGQKKATLEGHTGRVLTLAYGAEDRTLASGGTDGTVKLWDPAEGKERRTLGDGRPAP